MEPTNNNEIAEIKVVGNVIDSSNHDDLQCWKVEQREFFAEIRETVRSDFNRNKHRTVLNPEGFGRVISITIDLLGERIVSN